MQTRLGLTSEPIFFLDGHAFVYRGFYAYPDFKRADGFPTSAMFLVFKLLLKLLREERPTHLAFVTDGHGPTFRHDLYPAYKAQRPRMPEALAMQLEPLRTGLALMGIPVLVAEGAEADDYIASLTHRFKTTDNVVIVGADKDLRQCLDTNVILWDPAQNKEKIITLDDFTRETGLTPAQWADYQAMIGDSADNIPGIPKVGPKTALGLLRRYPSLVELRAHFDRLSVKEQTLLAPHMEQVFVYQHLTTLRTDLCPDLSREQLQIVPPDLEALRQYFQVYEFRSLLRELDQLTSTKTQNPAHSNAPPVDKHSASAEKELATTALTPRLVSTLPLCASQDVGLMDLKNGWAVGLDGQELVFMGSVQELEQALTGARVFVPSTKQIREQGILSLEVCAEVLDIELAAYLLSPEERTYSLERIRNGLDDQVDADPDNPGQMVLAVGRALRTLLAGSELLTLLHELEQPLVAVLVAMQERGICIDKAQCANLLAEVQQELDSLTTRIHAQAGQDFNIRSSQQLAEILFSRLGLASTQKTPKGALSTSSTVLEGLAGQHQIVADILEFRMYEKLRSTYLEPLPAMADDKGRIHTTLNHLATATGRLSSSNPNLQNIPIRGPLGARMRACFVAAKDHLLVAADYSQIELRVLAHLSGDPTLCQAFAEGADIHARTASILFDTTKVSPEERRKAKTINFGLLYGMGPQKLGRELGISLKQAKDFIAVYFSKLARIREFYEEIEMNAKAHGFVTTLAGRRRMLPDINSRNANLAQQARRMAINTVVQGSAADIIKKAMLTVHTSPVLHALHARLILQIHDELLLEAPRNVAREAGEEVARIMTQAYALSVPLAVDWGIGNDWNTAH